MGGGWGGVGVGVGVGLGEGLGKGWGGFGFLYFKNPFEKARSRSLEMQSMNSQNFFAMRNE